MANKNDEKSRLRIIAKYTTAVSQMAVIIVLGALGGKYIDSQSGGSGIWTAVLTIVAVALSLYLFIKDISR